MKVLVISAAYPPHRSGEATNAYHLCQQLAGHGFDVHVLTSQENGGNPEPSITVHPVMRSWSWTEVPKLRQFLKRCSPDVIFMMYLGWTYNFQFMSTFVPTIAKRVLPDVPFVTRFENVGGAGPQTNSFVSRLIRKGLASYSADRSVDYHFGTLLRDSDSIVLLSGNHEVVLEQVQPGIGKKCVLIPPPANMCMSTDAPETRERGRKALGATADDFLLSYIGFIYPGKGLDTMLRAFCEVARERSNVRLAIIGGSLAREFPDQPNYLERMQALARELGVEDKVVWTGEYFWDRDDASVYLRASDACILPFDTGVKLNNSSFSSAANHGLPIITTEPAERQFVHRQNVVLCSPKSPLALSQAITEVMDDERLRATLSEGSLALAREWYGWERALAKTTSLFERSPALDSTRVATELQG